MANTAQINPRMLRWAIGRAGSSPTDLAGPLKRTPDEISAWMAGDEQPTFRQAQDLALKVHVPFGYLFIEQPPTDNSPIPDFRHRPGGSAPHALSVDLNEVVEDAQRKQDWYRDYRASKGEEALWFVGARDTDDDPVNVAADIAKAIDFESRVRPERRRDDFLREFGRAVEDSGILMLKSSTVGPNTRRRLDPDEFQGFALADDQAPLVFVNGADYRAAQIFTLAHEVAHIWIGSSGISDLDLSGTDEDLDIERFCNRVAGDLLAPWAQIQANWPGPEMDLRDVLRLMAQRFNVSTVVIARQMLEHGAIDRDRYRELFVHERARWRTDQEDLAGNDDGGGNYYFNAALRNSRRFSRAVLASMGTPRTTVREAGQLLNMKPQHLVKLQQILSDD